METLPALQDLCEDNLPITDRIPSQRVSNLIMLSTQLSSRSHQSLNCRSTINHNHHGLSLYIVHPTNCVRDWCFLLFCFAVVRLRSILPMSLRATSLARCWLQMSQVPVKKSWRIRLGEWHESIAMGILSSIWPSATKSGVCLWTIL